MQLQQVRNDSITRGDVSELMRQQQIHVNKFIDVLTEHGFKKIGTMRRVNEAGLLSEMQPIKIEKKSIAHIVNDFLTYTRISKNDFVYQISNAFVNQILDMIEELDNEMITELAIMSTEIKRFAMWQEIENANNLTKLVHTFNSIYTKILQLTQMSSIETIVVEKQSMDTHDAFRTILSNVNTKKFFKNLKIFHFARNLLKSHTQNVHKKLKSSNIIISQLAVLSVYLSDSKSFYNFLDDLREKLSQYGEYNR